ncbi:PIN domain-containing protein [Nonomuraea sp. NPDC059194]|uniref:PIN domain-containing protein n=1 Tax=Nonomuraea sp. NPDC059194 TaxID=3346764 RepID=UPI00368B127F
MKPPVEKAEKPTFVFDSGALIQLERGNDTVLDAVARVSAGEAIGVVPRTVLAEIWRGGPRQARLAAMLKLADGQREADLLIDELTAPRAREIGKTIAACGHDDIVDVNVALCAREANGQIKALVFTTDRDDLLRVESALKTVIVDV